MGERGETHVIGWRLSAQDWILALVAGALFATYYALFGATGVDPSAWEDVASAAGLRPPAALFPGLWRQLAVPLFAACGVSRALRILSLAGAAGAGACVALSALIVRQLLSRLVRIEEDHPVWRRKIAPLAALAAATLVGTSDPLWRMAQMFSPDLMRLILTLGAAFGALAWLSAGGSWILYPVVAVFGILAAETPFAPILMALMLFAYRRTWNAVEDERFIAPRGLPPPEELPKWRMFFTFLAAFVLAARFNIRAFIALGGGAANGWSGLDFYVRYLVGYVRLTLKSASTAGWALGVAFGMLPAVVAAMAFPRVTRDDRPMPFGFGVLLVFAAALASLQAGVLPVARYWTYVESGALVSSDFVLALFTLAAAHAIALVAAAFALECQRLYREADAPRPRLALRLVPASVTLVLVLLTSFQLPRSGERQLRAVLDDALVEIVRECGDARFLFSDGRLDAGLELKAAARGARVRPLDLMSGASPRERALRTRFFASGQDRTLAETGVPSLLRTWAGEKPGGLDASALMLGFEYWQRLRKPLPTLSGFVGRTRGLDEAAAKRGIAAADRLAERLLAASSAGVRARSPALAVALGAISWRISRMARLRNDDRLADRLDAANTAIRKMLSAVEYERQRTFMQLTPREGLQLALKRTAFAEARRYAAAVLRSDEDDPEANFALAMDALTGARYAEAERYFRRCLKRRPEEPAVLNNLSIICRKAKRYDEAVELARQALKRLPDSKEVRQTLDDALRKAE